MGNKIKHTRQAKYCRKLNAHLYGMGFASADEYQLWCREYGLSARLKKPRKQLARERQLRRQTHVDEQLDGQVQFLACCRRQLRRIASGSMKPRSDLGSRFKGFAKLAADHYDSYRTKPLVQSDLVELIDHLTLLGSKLINPASCSISLAGNGITLAESLVLIANHRDCWLRPLREWTPNTKNARKQLRSLLRHLFDRYGEVPFFMDEAWSTGHATDGQIDPIGETYRQWYLHLGQGKNLRDRSDVPMRITKRIAHEFRRAPEDLTIAQCLRWAHARSLDASPEVARAVAGTRLGLHFDHEAFWESVIRWFADHPELETRHYGPLVDYIYNQRFVPARIFGATEQEDRFEIARPNFAIKGRTAETLLAEMDRWHYSLANPLRLSENAWRPSGLKGFRCEEGDADSEEFTVWTIRELVSGRELIEEGRSLQHCVASYISTCEYGFRSIWTLERQTKAGREKLVTIEVDPRSRAVVQARGLQNRRMIPDERIRVQQWCEIANLTLNNTV